MGGEPGGPGGEAPLFRPRCTRGGPGGSAPPVYKWGPGACPRSGRLG